jgi:hypothetical protein
MVIVALPPVRVVAAEVYPPPLSVTGWVVATLDGEGVTVTVGMVFAGLVTVTGFDPDALLYIEELLESGV